MLDFDDDDNIFLWWQQLDGSSWKCFIWWLGLLSIFWFQHNRSTHGTSTRSLSNLKVQTWNSFSTGSQFKCLSFSTNKIWIILLRSWNSEGPKLMTTLFWRHHWLVQQSLQSMRKEQSRVSLWNSGDISQGKRDLSSEVGQFGFHGENITKRQDWLDVNGWERGDGNAATGTPKKTGAFLVAGWWDLVSDPPP